eukprot:SAG11_NODE_15631_length_571_cov_1.099576_1_plen_38_part_10
MVANVSVGTQIVEPSYWSGSLLAVVYVRVLLSYRVVVR